MIFILNTLIELCLIFAVWRLSKRKRVIKQIIKNVYPMNTAPIAGRLDKFYTSAKIAEKFAERAFSLASSASLGVIALQKALQVPRLMTKQQATQNKLARNEVDKLFTTEGTFDWLRPILSEEENEILDQVEKDKVNGVMKT